MKKAKQLLAMALAAVLSVCTMAVSALAAPDDGLLGVMEETGTVTISNAMAGVTYEFYRVFDIDGVTSDGKKNSFITNEAWDAAVRTLTTYVTVANNGTGSLVTPKDDFAGGISNSKAQEFARDALAAGAGIDANKTVTIATSGTTVVDGLQYGFYVVKSSRSNENPNYTVFTLNSAKGVSIQEKNPVYPQIDKTVNGKKTTTSDFYTNLDYEIVVKAAAGTDQYTITDTLPDCIVCDAASLTVRLVLKNQNEIDGRVLTADEDYTVVTTPSETTGRIKTIEIKPAAALRNTLTDGDKLIIRYQAQIAANENTLNGYTNTVELTYSGEPRSSSATVFSGHISFYKHDGRTGANLAGAQFVIRKDSASGTQYAVLESTDNNAGLKWAFKSWTASKEDATVIETVGSQTNAHIIRGLAAGTYILEEIAAPEGYVKSQDTEVSIVAKTNGGEITSLDSDIVTIINNPGSSLPDTGGIGTTVFYLAGAALVLCALTLVMVKRRRKA